MDSPNSDPTSSPHRHRSHRRLRYRHRHRHYTESPSVSIEAADSPEVIDIAAAVASAGILPHTTSTHRHHHNNNNHHNNHHHRQSHRHHHRRVPLSTAALLANPVVGHSHKRHSHRPSLVRCLRNTAQQSINHLQDRIMNRLNEASMSSNQGDYTTVRYTNTNTAGASGSGSADTGNNHSSIYPSLQEQIRVMNNQHEQGNANSRYSRTANYGGVDDQLNEMHEFITSQSDPGDNHGQALPNYSNVPFNPYAPPSPHHHANGRHLFPFVGVTDFLNDPINASLTTFSRVTNLVRSPTTQIFNGASAAYNLLSNPNHIFTRPPGSAERVTIHSGQYPGFTGRYPYPDDFDGGNDNDGGQRNRPRSNSENDARLISHPPPVLPLIPNSNPQNRLEPLDLQEFESQQWSRDQFCQRIFKGGIIEDNQLRSRLWPIILGLYDEPKDKPLEINGKFEFDWSSHRSIYELYRSQWQAILPDQEKRFSLFRDRKSLIERDVIRCDRTHPFYRGESENLEKLRDLLLTYMMYDFDTGYVQGMSDLASPLLFVADGDVCKAFWYFVKVMEFTSNNFEMSQLTNHLQLEMLWKLIELTDPIFAQYLAKNESVNCYFAFRWIICQFKREFMKSNLDGYREVLILWESIWTCDSMRRLFQSNSRNNSSSSATECDSGDIDLSPDEEEEGEEVEIEDTIDTNQLCRSGGSSPPPSYLCATNQPNSDTFNDSELASRMDTALKINSESKKEEEKVEKITTTTIEEVEVDSDIAVLAVSATDADLNNDNNNAQAVDAQPTTTATATTTAAAAANNESARHSEHSSGSSYHCYHPASRFQQRRLSDHQLYVLCICLSIIRRERDLIMVNQYNASDILKHFNNLQLNSDLKNILLHAANIWSWLVFDGKEELLYRTESDNHNTTTTNNINDLSGANQGSGNMARNGPNNNNSLSSSNGAENGSQTQTGSTTAHPNGQNDASSSGTINCDDFDLLPDLAYSPIPPPSVEPQQHSHSSTTTHHPYSIASSRPRSTNSTSAIEDFIFHTT